ncbi:collagenase [Myxococcus landrumensis]|uniref:Collagenase n=1 Tax=Myxococcus landrumensis TaxID=2813577 RepID=A0ABX7NEP7_9BACT|nr:collagenase [Myxococcus landrumus]
MFERHSGQVTTLLGHLRSGNDSAYRRTLNNLGTSYDAELNQWIDCLATAGNPSTCANPLNVREMSHGIRVGRLACRDAPPLARAGRD